MWLDLIFPHGVCVEIVLQFTCKIVWLTETYSLCVEIVSQFTCKIVLLTDTYSLCVEIVSQYMSLTLKPINILDLIGTYLT